MTRSYPSSLPCPLVDGYSVAVKMNDYSSDSPIHNNQRRTFANIPHFFALTFVVNRTQWHDWYTFIKSYGYQWFSINLQTMYAAKTTGDKRTSPIDIRLTSPIRVTSMTKDYFKIQVNAESSPTALNSQPYTPPQPPVIPPSPVTWIVAKTPASVALDWWVAKTPVSPAADWTVAGTPNNPSA